MGNSSHPIFLTLNELLRSKNLKIKKSTLERFLEECDTTAPWFAVSRSLTIPSWEKLGKDLDFAAEQGMLMGGVRPIWKLVKSCLEDRKCSEAVENGQAAFEILQAERSEKAASEKARSDAGSSKEMRDKRSEKGKTRLYPSLSELEDSDTSDHLESDEEEEEDIYVAPLESIRRSLGGIKIKRRKREKSDQKQFKGTRRNVTPSAPPLNSEIIGAEGGISFNPKVWREVRAEMMMASAFPVFQDPQGNRFHEPLDFKVIKTLAESVRTYGIIATFMVAQVEALHRYAMTPADWMNLARACLSPG